MKTMLELLIRLDELRRCRDRVVRNPQFTNGEKACIRSYKQIVRECLPSVVLTHYDQMKKSERTLFSCPEVFAMAVLVSTYRSLSPRQRMKLVAHFTSPHPRTQVDKLASLTQADEVQRCDNGCRGLDLPADKPIGSSEPKPRPPSRAKRRSERTVQRVV
jgi:hypothetical protein